MLHRLGSNLVVLHVRAHEKKKKSAWKFPVTLEASVKHLCYLSNDTHDSSGWFGVVVFVLNELH